MLADTLKKIHSQIGCITKKDIESIREDLPNPTLPLLLKCGLNSRVVPMCELEHHIKAVEREGDHLRYVSLPLADMQPWYNLGYPELEIP
jgi:hypothetical protein